MRDVNVVIINSPNTWEANFKPHGGIALVIMYFVATALYLLRYIMWDFVCTVLEDRNHDKITIHASN